MSIHNLKNLEGNPVIVGAGIAGLATALYMAPRPVTIINGGSLDAGSTFWAQGGIAASLGERNANSHAQDTIAVSAGLCDPAIAKLVAEAGPLAIQSLEQWGVKFDRNQDGQFALGLEAGHSYRRIVHAGGDRTGRAIIAALNRIARNTPSIAFLDGVRVTSLVTNGAVIAGLVAEINGETFTLNTGNVVLATGGIGQLYRYTTNPAGAAGSGLLLAAHAGATLKDLEFVQFHPTCIAIGKDPMPLATEALRGEGARLITSDGKPATENDLGPRDIVARAIFSHIEAGWHVFLDCRHVPDVNNRFPSLHRACAEAGFNPAITPIPVRPAAHYHMGGVEVDSRGRTSVEGLWACGEVACTGLHGANRLASNSLLEAVVFAKIIAEHIPHDTISNEIPELVILKDLHNISAVRDVMDRYVGVVRSEEGLALAMKEMSKSFLNRDGAATLGFLIAMSAIDRRESRGAHFRSDYPEKKSEAVHSRLTIEDARAKAREMIS